MRTGVLAASWFAYQHSPAEVSFIEELLNANNSFGDLTLAIDESWSVSPFSKQNNQPTCLSTGSDCSLLLVKYSSVPSQG